MRIYDAHSPEADWQREQARECRARSIDSHDWPELPVLQPIAVRPVRVNVPEFETKRAADLLIFGECPECGGPNKRFHGCPAKD